MPQPACTPPAALATTDPTFHGFDYLPLEGTIHLAFNAAVRRWELTNLVTHESVQLPDTLSAGWSLGLEEQPMVFELCEDPEVFRLEELLTLKVVTVAKTKTRAVLKSSVKEQQATPMPLNHVLAAHQNVTVTLQPEMLGLSLSRQQPYLMC